MALVLYGEAAGSGYRPGHSPLSLIVVAKAVHPALLSALRRDRRSWRGRRFPIPLLMDPAYIEASLDVFPLEFLDIMDRHRLLRGDADPFAGLEIHREHLRLQVESQARGRMLHLWEGYLGAGRSSRTLRRLLFACAAEFEVILHGVLYLRSEDRDLNADSLLASVEKSFDLNLPTLRRLETVRQRGARITRRELEGVFTTCLDEVRSLVRAVNAL